MRRLPAPVALPTIVLTGWLTAAAAQNAVPEPSPPDTSQSDTGTTSPPLAPGEIFQPSPSFPGLVTGIMLGELYTDNLRLAAGSSQGRQSSWITEIQPFIRAARTGPYFSGTVNYELTGYLYSGGSNHNQATQRLDARGTVTLVPQHLFIEGTATYDRAVINNERPSGAGTFFLDNNHANVATTSLSPYWIGEVGDLGTAIFRYTHGRIVYNDRGIPGESQATLAGISDANSDAVQASLVSPAGRRLGWNLSYTEQRIEPDQGIARSFAVAKAGLYWQANPNLRLLADVGKENKYLPDGTIETLAAPFWDAGFQWSASRDHVRLLVGHRFYGRSGEFSWTHTAALLTTDVSYIERPTDLNQQLLGGNAASGGLPPIGTGYYIPSLAERRIYLMKRAMASATYEMPRGHLRLRLYDESRRYLTLDNQREKVADANLAWSIELGPRTTFTPSYGWQRYKFLNEQVDYTHFAELALVHRFNPNDFASLRWRNESRDAYFTIPGDHGYRVNVIALRWTHLF